MTEVIELQKMNLITKIENDWYVPNMKFPKPGVDPKVRKEAVDKWKIETGECKVRFKKDLFTTFNVDGPKAEKAFSLAWEYGHANGYLEVLHYFEDMSELIK